jgi:hypothetical protein
MATSTTPFPPIDPTVLAAIQAALSTGIKLNITGTLPGEGMITAILTYATEVRKTMDPALLKETDAITTQMLVDVYGVWRGIWVALGVVK